MASNTITKITPVPSAMKSTRFTKQNNWCVKDMELGENNVIALSGYHRGTRWTFVDLIVYDPDREGNCRVVYSREFEKHGGPLSRLNVSFLSDSRIVVTGNDKIESYDINKNVKINDNKFNGSASCMTLSEGEVYVGLYKSNKVIVFNVDLTIKKTITLSGIEDGDDYVADIAVMRAALFVCTMGCKALVYSASGIKLTPEPLTAKNKTKAWSIGVSSSGLVVVLWKDGTLITVFDMNALVEGHGGRHVVLFSFNVDIKCWKIRIMNNRLTIVNSGTDELREYNVTIASHEQSKYALEATHTELEAERKQTKQESERPVQELQAELRELKTEPEKTHREHPDSQETSAKLQPHRTSMPSKGPSPRAEASFDYGGFKIELAGMLDTSTVRKLAMRLNFSPAETDKITKDSDPGIELVYQLEAKGLMSEGDLSMLMRSLKDIGREGVADKLLNTFPISQDMITHSVT